MTITSTNHNPNNASKYARHRSIWSGRRNKLQTTTQALQATLGMSCFEYLGNTAEEDFCQAWGTVIGATRKLGRFMRHWEAKRPTPQRVSERLPPGLQGDLRLIWRDFSIVAETRLVGGNDDYNGDQLIFLAFSDVSLDLIFSKYGYGAGNRRNHHFFHWQARRVGVEAAVNVDDYLAAA